MTLDRAGVERLYRDQGHIVLRRARMILQSEADAQEALQEVFAALLRSPGELRAGSVVPWLYAATTHFCLNLLRNRRNGARLATQHLRGGSEAGSGWPDASAQVRSLLAVLPEEVGAAFVHHHLDGMTYDEIGLQLGCSRRKVGYLLQRARELFSEMRLEETA